MTASDVSICNSALIKIGADRISSLSEDNKRAQICKEQFEKCRDEVLQAHPWNFALKRASLARLVKVPAFEYPHAFQLPLDCLRVVKTQDYNIQYKVEGDQLLTFSDSIQIQYISKVTDPTRYTPAFREALACRLAADIAYAIVQSVQLTKTMTDLYEHQLRRARSMNAQEGTPDSIIADDWIMARF